LLQPDGPSAGEPWVFTDEQARIVLRWYQIDARGRFAFRRGVLRRMKGWGKDPFLAAIAAFELCGECRFGGFDASGTPRAMQHSAPWIQVAAVAKDQTRNTMTLFPGLFSPEAVVEYQLDIGKEIIYARGGRGRIEAVTSSPRALEGGRPSLVILNETHHWVEANEGIEMGDAIRRNLGKSRDGSARSMEITNAHLPGEGSVAEATHEAWVNSGGKLPGVYFDALESPLLTRSTGPGLSEVVPLSEMSDEQVRTGLLAARGDSEWVDPERLLSEIRDPVTPESQSRRFYFNQVTKVGAVWLPPGAWDACQDKTRSIPDHAKVVLGFDGSIGDDVTCLVVASIDAIPHVDVVQAWLKPADDPLWKVPRAQVKDAVRDACRRWKVMEVAWDMFVWRDAAEELADEGLPVVEFPQRGSHMIPATQRFYQAVVAKTMTHSGDKLLATHVANARAKTDSRGSRLVKDGTHSPRKIDLAVASVMAFERAAALAHTHDGGIAVASYRDFEQRFSPEQIAAKREAHQNRVKEIMARSARGSREERGYGYAHRQEREKWAPKVAQGGVDCARCHQRIVPGEEWHLDHADDRDGYLGPSHARCNDSAAGRKKGRR
jgi:hypothetical protein